MAMSVAEMPFVSCWNCGVKVQLSTSILNVARSGALSPALRQDGTHNVPRTGAATDIPSPQSPTAQNHRLTRVPLLHKASSVSSLSSISALSKTPLLHSNSEALTIQVDRLTSRCEELEWMQQSLQKENDRWRKEVEEARKDRIRMEQELRVAETRLALVRPSTPLAFDSDPSMLSIRPVDENEVTVNESSHLGNDIVSEEQSAVFSSSRASDNGDDEKEATALATRLPDLTSPSDGKGHLQVPTSRRMSEASTTLGVYIHNTDTYSSIRLIEQLRKELKRMSAQLLDETRRRGELEQAKANIESQLEDLSRSVFEEAQKMVVSERHGRAQAERKRNVLEARVQEMKGVEEILKAQLDELKQVVENVMIENQQYQSSRHSPEETGVLGEAGGDSINDCFDNNDNTHTFTDDSHENKVVVTAAAVEPETDDTAMPMVSALIGEEGDSKSPSDDLYLVRGNKLRTHHTNASVSGTNRSHGHRLRPRGSASSINSLPVMNNNGKALDHSSPSALFADPITALLAFDVSGQQFAKFMKFCQQCEKEACIPLPASSIAPLLLSTTTSQSETTGNAIVQPGSPVTTSTSKFLRRCQTDDVESCIRFDGAGYFLQRKINAGVQAGSLVIEPIAAVDARQLFAYQTLAVHPGHRYKPPCSLCQRECSPDASHRLYLEGEREKQNQMEAEMDISEALAQAQQRLVCPGCRLRLVTACEFWAYIRLLRRGLVRASPEQVYMDILRHRLRMFLARVEARGATTLTVQGAHTGQSNAGANSSTLTSATAHSSGSPSPGPIPGMSDTNSSQSTLAPLALPQPHVVSRKISGILRGGPLTPIGNEDDPAPPTDQIPSKSAMAAAAIAGARRSWASLSRISF